MRTPIRMWPFVACCCVVASVSLLLATSAMRESERHAVPEAVSSSRSLSLSALYRDEPSFVVLPDARVPAEAGVVIRYHGFTPDARDAFEYAARLWTSVLDGGPAPAIEARFGALPVGTLGVTDQPERDGRSSKVNVTLSSATDWYFGLDGQPATGQFDFVTVVLHELVHASGVRVTGADDGGHLDESSHPVGSHDSLMTSGLAQMEAVHDVGPLVRAVAVTAAPAPAGALDGVRVPAAPTGLTATVAGSTVRLDWNAPGAIFSPMDRAVLGYLIDAGFAPGVPFISIPVGNVTTVSVTAPDGTYYAAVRAFDATGPGARSNEVEIRVPAPGGPCTTAPATPLGLIATVVVATVNLTWTEAPGCPPTSFVIQAGSAPGSSDLAAFDTGSTATAFAAPGTPPGTYFIRLIARNGFGDSAPTPDVTAVVGGGPPPGPPGPGGFVGNWVGNWVNNTFGSTGAARMTVTVDETARTIQLVLDLDGNVFGGADPPPQTFNGTFVPGGDTTFASNTPVFGTVNMTITAGGQLTGTFTNLTNPGIVRVDLTGTVTPQAIVIDYTVVFAVGPPATGRITLNRS